MSSRENGEFRLIQESLLDIKERLERLEQNKRRSKPFLDVCVVAAERNTPSVPITTFQNEPSFGSQSAQASLSAEISVEGTGATDFNQEIQFSLASLKSLLQVQSLPSSVTDLYFPCSSSRKPTENTDLPPLSLVVEVLKKAAGMCCRSKSIHELGLISSSEITSRHPAQWLQRPSHARELMQESVLSNKTVFKRRSHSYERPLVLSSRCIQQGGP